ncbi:hypothetical protein [Streptomyces sp. NPDC102462]|uniref:hypothetical protein n=1 Tax=Streptomyces sp. NPDC102462 TaxID=3366178 RepID=UPI003800D54D
MIATVIGAACPLVRCGAAGALVVLARLAHRRNRMTAPPRTRRPQTPVEFRGRRGAAVSRLSGFLHAAYGALFGWLAWCAAQSARNHAPWACAAFVAGSCFVLVAVIREGDLANARRREALRAHRDCADASAAVAAVALAGWCCTAWAATAGAEHDATCRHRDTCGRTA